MSKIELNSAQSRAIRDQDSLPNHKSHAFPVRPNQPLASKCLAVRCSIASSLICNRPAQQAVSPPVYPEQSQGGLGIGLTLVRRLVDMHDGTIEVRSKGPNEGSEFIVRLPIDQPPHEPLPKSETPKTIVLSRCRILVVDDNKDSAETLGTLLKLKGNYIRTAHDGLEAVQAAEAFHPELVLLDIGLPKLNGYEVAQHIRRQPWGRDILLVALTGWGQEGDRRRSQEAGFNLHMVKPLELAELEQLLASL